MQTAKDSFFTALSTRLAALDATRTVTIEGVDRPAVVVFSIWFQYIVTRTRRM